MNLNVEKGDVETTTTIIHAVKDVKITFTQKELDDPTPLTFTRKQLFEAFSKKKDENGLDIED